MSYRRVCLILFALAFLLSCAGPAKVGTFPTLANQGQLALSTSNPYLGANLFLSRELERSRYLYNFFNNRGGPTAIEIIEDGSSATRVLLFYPGEKEVYVADMVVNPQQPMLWEWVVRGPYQIERQDYKNLARMEAAMNGEPIFEVRGKKVRFRFQQGNPSSEHVITPLPPPIPTPKPKLKPKIITEPKNVEPSQRDFRPLNSDQQALNMAKGFAERSSNGDVIHTVKADGQTLAAVAKWYTGAAESAKRLAAFNGVSEEAALNLGARIVIPLELVKEFKQMP